MGTNVRPGIVTNNLLIYLDAGSRMSYVSGSTTWTNLGVPRTAGINGTLAGTPTFSTANQGSFRLNGTTQYVDLGNNTTTQVTGSFSIGFVGYMSDTASATTTTQTLYGKQEAGGYGADTNGTPNGVVCYAYIAGGYLTLTDPISNYKNNQYFYHVMTYDSTISTLRMYRNGQLVASGVKAGSITNVAVPALIGANPGLSGTFNFPLSGSVAVYQHYGRTLSDQEVQQNYSVFKNRFGLP